MFLTEMLLVLYFLRPWSAFSSYLKFQEASFITLKSAIFVQIVCLCLLLVIRFVVIVTHAIDKSWGVVTKPFDFYAMTEDSDHPAIYTMLSGVAIRCANSVLWIFTRFTTCAAMTGIGLSSSLDAPSSLSLR
jgi:hypothetical protein